MQDFLLWFETGLTHILDLAGYDHICYVSALAILYTFHDWKKLLIQITAFTIGHSLSLAASVLEVVKVPQSIVEIIIPITIIITCIVNLINTYRTDIQAAKWNYILALIFGLIHGLGFSYLLKAMLGTSESIIAPLFAFNVGLEIGQIIIVGIVLFLTYSIEKLNLVKPTRWIQGVSITVLLIALNLLIERI